MAINRKLKNLFKYVYFVIIFSDLLSLSMLGRQFGRGRSGGQVRDEYRKNFDKERGGYGHMVRLEQGRRDDQEKNYEAITSIPEGASSNSAITPMKPKQSFDMNEDEPGEEGA